MPNVIVELNREVARVRALLPRLPRDRMEKAQRTVYYALQYMALNSFEEMRDSIESLKEIKEPKR